MTKIFYDTEFLEDGHTIDLISIGMTSENGDELYLISENADWNRIIRHDWLLNNVMPHLNFHPTVVAPRLIIRDKVRNFITSFPEPELWAWYSAYDHVALCQLFRSMNELPEDIPKWTNDLRQEYARLDVDPDEHKFIEDLNKEHHALADARNLKRRYELLIYQGAR